MTFNAALKTNYKQLIFVGAAFILMAGVSNYYIGVTMNKQAALFSRSEMQTYQMSLRALILAQEAALQHTAAGVVTALEQGAGPDELEAVFSTMTDILRNQKDIKDIFSSVYGYVKGNYYDATGWIPGEFYNPKMAPWLRGAITEKGIFHSRPFIDPRTGHLISSASMALSDRNGESLGGLAVDYLLDPIVQLVREYKLAESGFSFLLDDSFTTLAFPDPEFIGRKISDHPDLAGIETRLESLDARELAEEKLNIDGVRHIAFFSRLENGWFLGIAAPEKYYYGQASRTRWVISSLALVLSCGLGLILVRLAADKLNLEEKNRYKTTFLARMSHEIRTPLNAILGMSLLARRHYGAPEGLNHLTEISRTGNHLLIIINDILDLSRIETGNLELKNEPYRTKAVFNDILSIANIRITGLPLTLETDIDPQIPEKLIGDDGRVRQILMNLVSNAIKYTPAGFVRLRASGQTIGVNRIRLVFSVEDSGIGIKPEQLDLLFEEFVRLEQTQTKGGARPIEGAGLGLPITRSLCRAMGGDIAVTSEPGRGSTFKAEIIQTISDPTPLGVLEPGQPAETDDDPSPTFTTPGFKVLVIDDIATNLVVTEGLLSLYEAKTTTCLSGREGIEAAKQERFDLIFIDHVMPGLDGLETLKALREAKDYLKKTPMVALTANAMAGMREMFLSNGFDDYLTKPIQLDKLEEIMVRWVPEAARVPVQG